MKKIAWKLNEIKDTKEKKNLTQIYLTDTEVNKTWSKSKHIDCGGAIILF